MTYSSPVMSKRRTISDIVIRTTEHQLLVHAENADMAEELADLCDESEWVWLSESLDVHEAEVG